MSLELIKQKINNGEGYIQMKIAGLIKVKDMNPDDEIIWKPTKFDYKNIKNENDELQLKTAEEIQEEKNIKIQQSILNQFKPLIDAMTFQEISKSKGSNSENAIFTDDEIKNWGDYISEIANGNLIAEMPEIPNKYKKISGK